PASPKRWSPPQSACSPRSRPSSPTTASRATSIASRYTSRPSSKSSPTSFSATWARNPRPLRATDMPAVAHRGQRRRTMNEINMVPFIDVMLVLLIIFMVTAPLIAPSMIDLPSVGKASRKPDKVVEVLVGKDEKLELKNGDKTQGMNLADIAPAVLQAQSGQPPG